MPGRCAALVSVAASRPAIGPLAPAVALYTLATLGGWRRTVSVGATALAVSLVTVTVRHGPLGAPFTQSGLVLGAAALIGMYAGGNGRSRSPSPPDLRLPLSE